jgi:hypothetical protein
MRQIKLRAQQPEPPPRKLRLYISGRLAADLDVYCALYARTHGSEIQLPALIEGIVAQFLATDRAFQKRTPGAQEGRAIPTSAERVAENPCRVEES